jgi:hypothetical protein
MVELNSGDDDTEFSIVDVLQAWTATMEASQNSVQYPGKFPNSSI